jgi:hypothetical protein
MQIALKVFFLSLYILHISMTRSITTYVISLSNKNWLLEILLIYIKKKKIEYIQVGNKKKLKEIKLISVSMLTSNKNNNNNNQIDV